jgi:DUF4097 and DUF4098 domain-containing protein YvlB
MIFLFIATLLLLTSVLMFKGRAAFTDGRFMLGGGAVASESKVLSIDAMPTIVVDSDAGNVSLRTGSDGEVRVDVVKHARSQAELDEAQYTVETEGNSVHIVYRNPEGRRDNCSVDFTIFAPRDSGIHVETGGGNVDASGFTGGMNAHTGGGSLETSKVEGKLQLSTGGGNIRCDQARGNVVLSTGAGNIAVTGLASGECRVNTGGGNIELAGVYGSVDARTGAGNVAIKGGLRGVNWISTGAGNVRADLGPATNVAVHASTNVGSVSNEFGLSSGDGRSIGGTMDGQIGAGDEGSLTVTTGVGNVDLSKLVSASQRRLECHAEAV